MRLNGLDLSCEHVNRCFAHLAHKGKTFVVIKVNTHVILLALDTMARDLRATHVRHGIGEAYEE